MKKRHRRGRKGRIVGVLLSMTLFLVLFIYGYQASSNSFRGTNYGAETVVLKEDNNAPIAAPELYSKEAILVKLADHSVAYDKNSRQKINPASLTKILTTIVCLENIADLEEPVTVPQEIFGKIYSTHASVAGFEANETVSALDLLYGVMLPSGADASLALAWHIAGSEEKFVQLMNEKSAELGLEKSNFTNVTGVYDRQHYTTVLDLAKCLVYALQKKPFREIFTSHSYTTRPTKHHPEGLTFASPLFSFDQAAAEDNILGGKTGYVKESGLCLATLGLIDGQEYILITAGAPGNHGTAPYHVWDAVAVFGG